MKGVDNRLRSAGAVVDSVREGRAQKVRPWLAAWLSLAPTWPSQFLCHLLLGTAGTGIDDDETRLFVVLWWWWESRRYLQASGDWLRKDREVCM